MINAEYTQNTINSEGNPQGPNESITNTKEKIVPQQVEGGTVDDMTLPVGKGNSSQAEEDFPPLPTRANPNVTASSEPRTGRVRLIFGKSQTQGPESTKHQQPPSPMKDRTPKRHTSEAVPSICTPKRLTTRTGVMFTSTTPHSGSREADTLREQSPSVADSPTGRPSPTASQQPEIDMTGDRNGPLNGSYQQTNRDSMEVDQDFADQSATAIADYEWDDILNDTPSISHPSCTPFRFSIPSTEIPTPQNLSHPKASANIDARRSPLTTPNTPLLATKRINKQSNNTGIHSDTKEEDHIVTNSAGLQRTATPNGGWPKIHLDSNPLDNVAPAQITAWKKVVTGKLWARIFRGKYEQNSLGTVDKTRAIIKSLILIENDVTLGVSFPQQERSMDSDRFPTPYHMLVSGLTHAQVEHLTRLEIVSTKEITVIFKPFKDQRPSFVLTIYGLTFNDSQEAHTMVTDLVKTCIKDSEQIMKHILECAPQLKDRVLNDILNNISVKFLDVKRSAANGGPHQTYPINEDVLVPLSDIWVWHPVTW
ncbi:hypothetical protein C0993_001348 [Termitomyces sp. T159_Od127]|nr:hypothetical protein C0993_001348 [Termitomyces sp. T159_Od127]